MTCDELHKLGTKIVAIGDRYGSIRNMTGINIPALQKYVQAPENVRHTIVGYPKAEAIPDEELLITPCTVLIPAATERVINKENAAKLQCRVIAEGANGPTTPEADRILAGSDIFIIPDVLCNAGGVTVSYFEWVQDLQQFMWDDDEVTSALRKQMLKAYAKVRHKALSRKLSMRTAALSLGVEKVANEKAKRGLFP